MSSNKNKLVNKLDDKDIELIEDGYKKDRIYHYQRIIEKLTGKKIPIQGCDACLSKSMYQKIKRLLEK